MNEVINILKKYFDDSDINKLIVNIDTKKRNSIMNDKYFAKISINGNSVYCNKFINEINLYNKNNKISIFPKIDDSLINSEYCLLVLDRIPLTTIGNSRNEFNLRLSNEDRKCIISNILEIKNIKVNFELDNSYSRIEKLETYLSKTKEYIPVNIQNEIKNLKNSIICEKYERVLSHGDLISTNIMIENNKVYFLDWEYVSFKPMYYDLAYFLLFSKENNSFDILNELEDIDKNEVYKDGIIICLKEINENIKLYNIIDKNIVNRNINRWINELEKIIDKLKKNE